MLNIEVLQGKQRCFSNLFSLRIVKVRLNFIIEYSISYIEIEIDMILFSICILIFTDKGAPWMYHREKYGVKIND